MWRRRTSMRRVVLGGALGLSMGLGCVDIGHFPCERDSQCELGGRVGRCFDPGYCALPDGACPSGYRFDAGSVPPELEGRCADPPAESSTSGGSTTGPESTGESSSSGTSSGGESSSSDSGSSTSTTGNICGDHPCGCTASLAVGIRANCVARFDGRVACWGANGWAELGDGQISEFSLDSQEAELPEELSFTTVTAGNHHLCARTDDGTALCWGRNSNREIDPGTSLSSLGPVTPAIEGAAGAIGLSPQHSCVGTIGGPELRCLGNNGYDKLGIPSGNLSDLTLPGGMAVEGFGLGRDHSCAMAGGRVWCWGRNNVGQVGEPMVDPFTDQPTEVSFGGDALMITSGRDHTCIVRDVMNSIACWGRNTAGQVGDGTQTNRFTPTPIDGPLPGTVIDIIGRYDSTCALLDNGDVWCWGGTNGDDLGTAARDGMEVREPMRVEVIGDLPETLVEIGLGQYHLCGRAESGRLWCWGQGHDGQIGPSGAGQDFALAEIDVGCPPGVGN